MRSKRVFRSNLLLLAFLISQPLYAADPCNARFMSLQQGGSESLALENSYSEAARLERQKALGNEFVTLNLGPASGPKRNYQAQILSNVNDHGVADSYEVRLMNPETGKIFETRMTSAQLMAAKPQVASGEKLSAFKSAVAKLELNSSSHSGLPKIESAQKVDERLKGMKILNEEYLALQLSDGKGGTVVLPARVVGRDVEKSGQTKFELHVFNQVNNKISKVSLTFDQLLHSSPSPLGPGGRDMISQMIEKGQPLTPQGKLLQVEPKTANPPLSLTSKGAPIPTRTSKVEVNSHGQIVFDETSTDADAAAKIRQGIDAHIAKMNAFNSQIRESRVPGQAGNGKVRYFMMERVQIGGAKPVAVEIIGKVHDGDQVSYVIREFRDIASGSMAKSEISEEELKRILRDGGGSTERAQELAEQFKARHPYSETPGDLF